MAIVQISQSQSQITLAASGASDQIPFNPKVGFNAAYTVTVSGTPDFTYDVEITLDGTNWFKSSTGTTDVASNGNFTYPIKAIRLNATAYVSGTMTLTTLAIGND